VKFKVEIGATRLDTGLSRWDTMPTSPLLGNRCQRVLSCSLPSCRTLRSLLSCGTEVDFSVVKKSGKDFLSVVRSRRQRHRL
jgi:hypothetical protein